jgi:hypothetical protein
MGLLFLVAGSLFRNINASSARGASLPGRVIRSETFTTPLNSEKSGDRIRDFSNRDSPQAWAVAGIIRRTRPDVLLINVSDFDPRSWLDASATFGPTMSPARRA